MGMNAFCRGHPAGSDGKKSMKRRIWEYVHKTLGYASWILGCYAAMLGLQVFGKDKLADLHVFVWCLILLVVYIALTFVGCFCVDKEKCKRQQVNIENTEN